MGIGIYKGIDFNDIPEFNAFYDFCKKERYRYHIDNFIQCLDAMKHTNALNIKQAIDFSGACMDMLTKELDDDLPLFMLGRVQVMLMRLFNAIDDYGIWDKIHIADNSDEYKQLESVLFSRDEEYKDRIVYMRSVYTYKDGNGELTQCPMRLVLDSDVDFMLKAFDNIDCSIEKPFIIYMIYRQILLAFGYHAIPHHEGMI